MSKVKSFCASICSAMRSISDCTVSSMRGVAVTRSTPTLPELRVIAELADAADIAQRESIRTRLVDLLARRVRIRVDVDLRDPGSLPRQEAGKAKRVYEQTTDESPIG